MPHPWRTVYKSAHKEVRIRPRNNQHATHTLNISNPCLVTITLSLGVLLALHSLVVEFWLLILIGLAFHGMLSKRRR